jgi:predicted DNA-binding transcriptional regulator YafY
MPASKNTLSRYQIINACFLSKNKKYWSFTDLLQELEEHDLFISKRTLEMDIEAMRYDSRLRYYAPIEYCALNRGYHYTDSTYSINGIGLSNEEIQSLLLAGDLMQPYGNISMLRNFQAVICKVVSHVNNKMLPAVPPLVPEIKCIHSIADPIKELIDRFLIAIRQKVVVKIIVNENNVNDNDRFFFHPYSLYTDPEHWYIVGLREADNMLIYLQLEWIKVILFSTKSFKPFEKARKEILGEA